MFNWPKSCQLSAISPAERDNSKSMKSTIRKPRSFSLDPDVWAEVERTKENASASERVNHLLKSALMSERKAGLSQEAAQFFGTAPDDREERRALQKAGVKPWVRE